MSEKNLKISAKLKAVSGSKALPKTSPQKNDTKERTNLHNNKSISELPPKQLADPKLTQNALTVLKRRYLKKDENSETIETAKDMFLRVARAIGMNELNYKPDCDVEKIVFDIYSMMANLDFIPNSPTLMNAGRQLGQLAACFVLPIDDSMYGIFEAIKNAALVHKSGGGTGFSFSRIREKSAPVKSTAGTASGPISFMTVFNSATETIKQGGTRRGANMGMLRIDHPDIRDFIVCKSDMESITNFNISVAVTDEFMRAVKNNQTYDLVSPYDNRVVKKENARDIFQLIAKNAWLNGDPGLVFIDEVNRHEKTPQLGEVEATNPCGEQPLLPYESCNLGSINLNNMLTEDLQIDWDHLRDVVRLSVRFLDNIVDLNKFPIEKIKEMTQKNRRIGLGIMGFSDLLYASGIPYNSERGVDMGREIMRFIHLEGRKMSDELAEERGAFPNCEGSVFDHPTRNSTVTTLAPTGTISMIADTSGGVEPNFALCYVKRVMDDDRLLYVNARFEETARREGWYSPELMEKIADGANFSSLEDMPEDARKIFVTAHDISPEWHIRMQAAFQEYTDNAVSKTINFPNKATILDVKNAYILAWEMKCKGITIYRDGSRDVQVMNVGKSLAGKDSGNANADRQSIQKLGQQSLLEGKSEQAGQGISITRNWGGPLKPRQRPLITRGHTEQIMTGEGALYITINEDDQGLCEVFASIGKSGGNAAAQSEAVGRLISLALRAGVDPRAIVKQLKGITGTNPVWHEGELIRSTPDAIGRSLERALNVRENQQAELPLEDMAGKSASDKTKIADHEMGSYHPDAVKTYFHGEQVREICPDCGNFVIFEEGCMVCKYCGYSKCE